MIIPIGSAPRPENDTPDRFSNPTARRKRETNLLWTTKTRRGLVHRPARFRFFLRHFFLPFLFFGHHGGGGCFWVGFWVSFFFGGLSRRISGSRFFGVGALEEMSLSRSDVKIVPKVRTRTREELLALLLSGAGAWTVVHVLCQDYRNSTGPRVGAVDTRKTDAVREIF